MSKQIVGCKIRKTAVAQNCQDCKELWDFSCALVQVYFASWFLHSTFPCSYSKLESLRFCTLWDQSSFYPGRFSAHLLLQSLIFRSLFQLGLSQWLQGNVRADVLSPTNSSLDIIFLESFIDSLLFPLGTVNPIYSRICYNSNYITALHDSRRCARGIKWDEVFRTNV